MTEKNESRIKVEDLPAPEKELTPEEAKGIQGGQEDQALRGEAANIKAPGGVNAVFADGSVRFIKSEI